MEKKKSKMDKIISEQKLNFNPNIQLSQRKVSLPKIDTKRYDILHNYSMYYKQVKFMKANAWEQIK